jgi:MFS family permease
MSSNADGKTPMTFTAWLVCIISSIGFAFDTYQLLILPLIVGPSLRELIGAAPGSELFNTWVGRLFYIPAFAGAVFGLLGGWLTDRLGRRRILTYSIMVYAIAAFAAGYSTSVWMLLITRCFVFVGVCVEFVAAVAWLAELFPNKEQKEKVLGYTQAFASIGGFMVAFANSYCVSHAPDFPALHLPEWLNFFGETLKDPQAPWRYTLISGLIPAIPLIFIRPFLPESPSWAKNKAAGTLRRPSFAEIFSPQLRKTTIITTLMFACSYGAAFGAIQHIPRIIPGLAEVKAKAAAAADKAVAGKPEAVRKQVAAQAQGRARQAVAAHVTKFQETGGLLGRIVFAILAVHIVSRQKLMRLFLIPGLIVMPVVFAWFGTTNLQWLEIGIFVAGFLTVAQFSFWGNYLPRVYPLHLRGTGESFAANIGGRLLGTLFAWVTAHLAVTASPAFAPTKLAYTAAGVGFAVYLAGLLLSYALPEPHGEEQKE